MKKVFFKCVRSDVPWYVEGNEYEVINGRIVCEDQKRWFSYIDEGFDIKTQEASLTRIKREVFHAHGVEWYESPENQYDSGCPVDGSKIELLFNDGERIVHTLGEHWNKRIGEMWIGWRYYEEPAKTVAEAFAQTPCFDGILYDEVGNPLGAGSVDVFFTSSIFQQGRAVIQFSSADDPSSWSAIDWAENVDMIYLDELAAMDDGHLTPGQKRYIQAKEDEQASKEREASAMEQLKKSEQAKALQEAAGAMDKVKPGFSSQMGWMA